MNKCLLRIILGWYCLIAGLFLFFEAAALESGIIEMCHDLAYGRLSKIKYLGRFSKEIYNT
jgi:hypothetical protein